MPQVSHVNSSPIICRLSCGGDLESITYAKGIHPKVRDGMDDITISELDEASIRIFSLQCAMQVIERTEGGVSAEQFIDTAMEFENYIDNGGSVHFTSTLGH